LGDQAGGSDSAKGKGKIGEIQVKGAKLSLKTEGGKNFAKGKASLWAVTDCSVYERTMGEMGGVGRTSYY